MSADASVDSGVVEDTGTVSGDASIDGFTVDSASNDGGIAPIQCLSPGMHRDQTYQHEGETRYYFLYVPAGHRCGEPLPLWIDFHGTAADHAEEAYGLEAMTTLADREHVLVVRPRSRPSDATRADAIYQWDFNPGDITRNAEYIESLTEDLAVAYSVDRTRMFASGFSSGSNMAAQILARSGAPFTAYGFIAGGAFTSIRVPTFESPPRLYAATGHRDYLRNTRDRLLDAVERAGIPSERVFERETDSGHDLYDWHFEEMWTFFTTGEREVESPLRSEYTRIDTPTDDSLLEIDVASDGAWIVSSEGPAILRRSGDEWTRIVTPATAPSWSGLCTMPGGVAVAVGGGYFTSSSDSGQTWSPVSQIPDFGGAMFGYSFMTTVGCSSSGVLAGGYWAAAASTNGRDWTGVDIQFSEAGFTIASQNAAMGRGANGTDIAVGYYRFIGRRALGGEFVQIPTDSLSDWYLDIDEGAPGTWLVVGDRGTVLRSLDDGLTFDEVASGTNRDLYAVDLGPDGEGIAVGLHGTVIHTSDAGRTWRDISPGVIDFLGDVRMLGPGHAVIVGEHGLVLEYRAE
jgi:photosystem II stability/assembly factor-like uncharacterized protein/predicted esterase